MCLCKFQADVVKWQTRKVQVLMRAISCRFKSCHPHQLIFAKSKKFAFAYDMTARNMWRSNMSRYSVAKACSLQVPVIRTNSFLLKAKNSHLLMTWLPEICDARTCLAIPSQRLAPYKSLHPHQSKRVKSLFFIFSIFFNLLLPYQ